MISFTQHVKRTQVTYIDNQVRCPEWFSAKLLTELDHVRSFGTPHMITLHPVSYQEKSSKKMFLNSNYVMWTFSIGEPPHTHMYITLFWDGISLAGDLCSH